MAGDYGMPPAPAAKSGGVVAVAVMAFVVAGLDLICGVLFFCAGGLLTGVSGASGEFREKLDAEMRKQGKSLDAPDVAPVLKAVGTVGPATFGIPGRIPWRSWAMWPQRPGPLLGIRVSRTRVRSRTRNLRKAQPVHPYPPFPPARRRCRAVAGIRARPVLEAPQ